MDLAANILVCNKIITALKFFQKTCLPTLKISLAGNRPKRQKEWVKIQKKRVS